MDPRLSHRSRRLDCQQRGQTVYVYRNGVEIGRAGIANPKLFPPLNDRVFQRPQGTDTNGHLRWVQ